MPGSLPGPWSTIGSKATVVGVRPPEQPAFVIGRKDQQRLVPVAVRIDPSDDRLDGLDEIDLLLDHPVRLVGVVGPIDGPALDHQVEAFGVLVEAIDRRFGHGGQRGDVLVGGQGERFSRVRLPRRQSRPARPRFSWSVLPTRAVPTTFGGVGPEVSASKSALLSISFQAACPT